MTQADLKPLERLNRFQRVGVLADSPMALVGLNCELSLVRLTGKLRQ